MVIVSPMSIVEAFAKPTVISEVELIGTMNDPFVVVMMFDVAGMITGVPTGTVAPGVSLMLLRNAA